MDICQKIHFKTNEYNNQTYFLQLTCILLAFVIAISDIVIAKAKKT